MTEKLMARACGGALAAFVFGLCFGHIFIKHVDLLFLAGAVLSAAAVVFVILSTRNVLRGFAVSEASRQSVRTFLWSCVFFAMISSTFGLQVAGVSWFGTDFLRKFGFVFWGLLTCIAIYPVRRDARRVTSAVDREAPSR